MKIRLAVLDQNDDVVNVIVVREGTNYHVKPGFTYIETDREGKKTKNYARRDTKFDRTRNAFIPPKPFPSWRLNEENLSWDAPTTPLKDADGKIEPDQSWNEEKQKWEKGKDARK